MNLSIGVAGRLLEYLVRQHVVSVSITSARVPLECVHVGSHPGGIVNWLLLIWDCVCEICGWKSMIRHMQSHLVVVGRILYDFEGKADAVRLAGNHVIWTCQVVVELFFRGVGMHFPVRNDGDSCIADNLFSEDFVILVDVFLYCVLMVYHTYNWTCPFWG